MKKNLLALLLCLSLVLFPLLQGYASNGLPQAKLLARLITWPNNTACSMGERFRDTIPELTNKWYMYTALDLSVDGMQDIPLFASNRYVIGTVHVNVQGGAVTITFDTVAYRSVDVKEEFLCLLPSLDGLTAVEPEDLADKNLPFGVTLDLAQTLGEGRNVYLFMRLLIDYYVVTYWF